MTFFSKFRVLLNSNTSQFTPLPLSTQWRGGWGVRFAVVLAASLLLAGCGGLAGEPRIVSTLPPSTAAPTEAPYPSSPPDIAAGAQIFAENCTRCHGVGGAGDGELVKSGQVPPPL